jgi:hypothetical protein
MASLNSDQAGDSSSPVSAFDTWKQEHNAKIATNRNGRWITVLSAGLPELQFITASTIPVTKHVMGNKQLSRLENTV